MAQRKYYCREKWNSNVVPATYIPRIHPSRLAAIIANVQVNDGAKPSAIHTRQGYPGSLRWRHNDHDGVSNHQPHGCLFNRLFRRRSKKTSQIRVTGLCAGNSPGPVNSPHKGPVTRKMFPFDDVTMYFQEPHWKPMGLPQISRVTWQVLQSGCWLRNNTCFFQSLFGFHSWFSAFLAFSAGNSPVPGEFPPQRPVTRSFDVFFGLCRNKQLSKQSRRWWFEMPSRTLWRHCNLIPTTFLPWLWARAISNRLNFVC